MSGPIKGYPSRKRNLNLQAEDVYITGSPTSASKQALDVNSSVFGVETGTDIAIDSVTSVLEFVSSAHTAKPGDKLRFSNGATAIVQQIDGTTIKLGDEPDPAILATDTFDILTPATPMVDADGNIITTSTPVKYVLDGVDTEVTRDTATPANNKPLPVEIIGAAGQDINITAGDINVQTTHAGANADSVRVGDGTETLEITATGQAQTNDSTTHTKLDTAESTRSAMQTEQLAQGVSLDDINTELDSQTALLTTMDADTGSIDTKLTATNASLASIDGKDFATQTTLAGLLTELQLKADLTETQPVSAASLPLPTGAATEATLASLAAEDFASQTTLAALLTELQAKADLSETQPVSAASLPLPTGAATEATLASLAAEDFASQTTLAALLVELQAKADLSETQPVSAASLPLPTGAATETTLAALAAEDFASETTLASLLTELQLKADLSETQPVSAASLPLPSGAATEASLLNVEAKTPSGSILAGIEWDHNTFTPAASTDTYVFKTGGAGGTTVATVLITYTDTTKAVISTVART